VLAAEEGTLARLKAVRKALVDPTIAKHRRIVKTTGDGSINGAGKLDQHEQSADVPPEVRIEFRIVESRSVSCDATITRLR
jgi:adenylate cyclase